MNEALITGYSVVSDCLGCQAEEGSWARTSRALALRRTRSLCARAIRITFFGLPARVSRRWKSAKSGLCRRTSSATTNRIERMPLRPPRTERLPLSLPLSRAIGARPASLLTALLERVPISGSSAIRRATVRSATPLISRQLLHPAHLIALQTPVFLAPAVVGHLGDPNRAYRLGHRCPLRRQHIDLAQLGDNLLGLVPLSCHRSVLLRLSRAIPQGGPLQRGRISQTCTSDTFFRLVSLWNRGGVASRLFSAAESKHWRVLPV